MIETLMGQASDSASLVWRISDNAGVSTVTFTGEIDENVDFSELTAWLSGRVAFHLKGVRHINSIGVREWMYFIRSLKTVTELSFVHCSPAMVARFSTVSNFRGQGQALSFYAHYVCSGCQAESAKLIDIKVCFPEPSIRHPPTFTCDACSHPLEFDEVPESYLAFLWER